MSHSQGVHIFLPPPPPPPPCVNLFLKSILSIFVIPDP